MGKPRIQGVAALLVASVVVLTQLAPLDAGPSDDPRVARDRVRAERAQLARQLDGLHASEEELREAAAALDDQVGAQEARVDAARQAVEAAEAERAQAQQRLQETTVRRDGLVRAVVDRAVQSFMRPDAEGFDEVVQSEDIVEAARKSALLGQVTAQDEDVIDELHAAEEDYELERRAAEAAGVVAEQRRVENQARLDELAAAKAEKDRLAEALEARQADVVAESEALQQSEASLTRIIEAEAAAAAARAVRERQQREAATRASQQRSRSAPTRSAAAVTSPTPAPLPVQRGSGACGWPSRGTVTSEFGTRWGRLHAGIDISAPIGTPISAAQGGSVIFAGTQNGYGNVVMISHGGGLTTVYAHQSRIATSQGSTVSSGQLIGYVGNTGQSTGPHLHFETRYGGAARNPRGCLG